MNDDQQNFCAMPSAFGMLGGVGLVLLCAVSGGMVIASLTFAAGYFLAQVFILLFVLARHIFRIIRMDMAIHSARTTFGEPTLQVGQGLKPSRVIWS